MKYGFITIITLAGILAFPAQADFILNNIEHFDVVSHHDSGTLSDSSSATIFPGGDVNILSLFGGSSLEVMGGSISTLGLYETSSADIYSGFIDDFGAANSSIVHFYGGGIGQCFHASQESKVYFSGGGTSYLSAGGSSTINVSGGFIGGWGTYGGLFSDDTSTVHISGGEIDYLHALQSSITTFYGYDFELSGGLTLDGNEVLGTGILAGTWNNGATWEVQIYQHDPAATILLVPEPATVLLLGLGGLAFRRKR